MKVWDKIIFTEDWYIGHKDKALVLEGERGVVIGHGIEDDIEMTKVFLFESQREVSVPIIFLESCRQECEACGDRFRCYTIA